MSPDSHADQRPGDQQRWYSGYLIVKEPSIDTLEELALLANEVGILDISPTAIEVEYKGRDSSHVVVRTLLRLARLVREATGEIQCEVSGDADQLWFEFYRIRDGRLFRQLGEVVRQPEQEVSETAL